MAVEASITVSNKLAGLAGLGISLSKAGLYDSAIATFQQHRKLNGKWTQVSRIGFVNATLIKNSRPLHSRIKTYVNTVVNQEQDPGNDRYLEGYYYYRTDSIELAKQSFLFGVGLAPRNFSCNLGLATLYMPDPLNQDAFAHHLNAASEEQPNHQFLVKIHAYYQIADLELFCTRIKDIIDRGGHSLTVEDYHNHAIALYKLGKYDEPINSFRIALSQHAGPKAYAPSVLGLASCLVHNKQYSRARSVIAQLDSSDRAKGRVLIADLLMREEAFLEAGYLYGAALSDSGTMFSALHGMAWSKLNSGPDYYHEAVRYMTAALKNLPSYRDTMDYEIQANIAIFYQHKWQKLNDKAAGDSAISIMQRVLAQYPDPYLATNMGYILQTIRKDSSAKNFYVNYIDIALNNKAILILKEAIKNKDCEGILKATKMLKKANELSDPEYPSVHKNWQRLSKQWISELDFFECDSLGSMPKGNFNAENLLPIYFYFLPREPLEFERPIFDLPSYHPDPPMCSPVRWVRLIDSKGEPIDITPRIPSPAKFRKPIKIFKG
jgi:tetratricopeptide (TPR) repeat protein